MVKFFFWCILLVLCWPLALWPWSCTRWSGYCFCPSASSASRWEESLSCLPRSSPCPCASYEGRAVPEMHKAPLVIRPQSRERNLALVLSSTYLLIRLEFSIRLSTERDSSRSLS